jgi:hypothetical protein
MSGYPSASLKAGCLASCRSGTFETGQGTCAIICMTSLGDPRKVGCPMAVTVHGIFVSKILDAAKGVA